MKTRGEKGVGNVAAKARMVSEAALPGVVGERAAEKGAKADWKKQLWGPANGLN
jgi:hypothetical protein